MRSPRISFALVGGAAIVTLALAGCATPGVSAADDGRLSIVASTSVYGDIAQQIVGDLGDVKSLVTNAAQDPHSYEASAQDQLALSRADLVIQNGGGYDPFIDTLLGDDTTVRVVDASEASGLIADRATDHAEGDPTGEESPDHIEGFNEHVWYSLEGVEKVADAITDELSALDAPNTSTYRQNYVEFAAALTTLRERVQGLELRTAGLTAAITEPVPPYLLADAGFANATPEAFSEAIEEGTDVAPTVLQETLALFDSGSVALLAYNAQTASPETERVREAAEAAGVPVIDFTETLPDGVDYLGWMTANVDAIESATN